jgi:arginine N-succinyltransferase
MSEFAIRAATSEDLPQLAGLLPAWTLETAGFVDGDDDDRLLLAVSAGQALGCLRVRRRVGLDHPRYWFHVGFRVHAAVELAMFRRERTLLLGNDHTGAAELSEFALRAVLPESTTGTALAQELVAKALRWLLQEDPGADDLPKVIAALPGPRSADGSAPFWNGLGRHFYAGDVEQALARFGTHWQTHVAALLPRHPLVVSVLHADVQDAIGAIHPDARVWRDALADAGLRAGQHIGLHDGGPVYEAHRDLLAGMPR